MSIDEARRVLNAARAGCYVSIAEITQALIVTGDLCDRLQHEKPLPTYDGIPA